MKNLFFETLDEKHISAIMEIERISQSSAWSEQSFRNEIRSSHAIFLVAIYQSKVIGYAGAWIIVDEAHITTVAIHPDHRRKHFGQALIQELITRSRDAGATCSTLEVRVSNEPAIKLYEKFGFEACGLRKRYYPDNHEDAAIMWAHDLSAILA